MKPGSEVWGYGFGTPNRIERWFGAFESRDECEREALKSCFDDESQVWIQSGTVLNPLDYMPSATEILELINECGGEVHFDDDAFEATDDAMKELDTILSNWAGRHLSDGSHWCASGDPECVRAGAAKP